MEKNTNTHTGGYDAEGVIWHQHSNKLMIKILEFFKSNTPVIDLGCGHNFYVSVLRYMGYEAWGMDMVDLGSKYFIQCDVTEAVEGRPDSITKNNVISLEVGEHIPAEKSEPFLDNIVSFAGGGDVLLSWAVPGQAGIGHINCRTNEWVIEQMEKRGYNLDYWRTEELRHAVEHCHCSWFRNTLMYFTSKTETSCE